MKAINDILLEKYKERIKENPKEELENIEFCAEFGDYIWESCQISNSKKDQQYRFDNAVDAQYEIYISLLIRISYEN